MAVSCIDLSLSLNTDISTKSRQHKLHLPWSLPRFLRPRRAFCRGALLGRLRPRWREWGCRRGWSWQGWGRRAGLARRCARRAGGLPRGPRRCPGPAERSEYRSQSHCWAGSPGSVFQTAGFLQHSEELVIMNNLKLGINETSLWTFLMWVKGETALLAGMEQQGSCRRAGTGEKLFSVSSVNKSCCLAESSLCSAASVAWTGQIVCGSVWPGWPCCWVGKHTHHFYAFIMVKSKESRLALYLSPCHHMRSNLSRSSQCNEVYLTLAEWKRTCYLIRYETFV